MSLKEPIVEGAYYVARDGIVLRFGKALHDEHAKNAGFTRVHFVPADPAEVVAELRERSSEANRLSAFGYGDAPSYHAGRNEAFDSAADLVAKKLGVE